MDIKDLLNSGGIYIKNKLNAMFISRKKSKQIVECGSEHYVMELNPDKDGRVKHSFRTKLVKRDRSQILNRDPRDKRTKLSGEHYENLELERKTKIRKS